MKDYRNERQKCFMKVKNTLDASVYSDIQLEYKDYRTRVKKFEEYLNKYVYHDDDPIKFKK